MITEWSRIGPRPPAAARAMTAGEVRRLAALPGVSIGAHSAHHLSLPVLSLEQQRLEIETCKARLEALVGCYMADSPTRYRAHDAETERLVRLAGFKVAVTTVEQPVKADVDPFLVLRFGVRRGGATFAGRLSTIVSSSDTSDAPVPFLGSTVFGGDAR